MARKRKPFRNHIFGNGNEWYRAGQLLHGACMQLRAADDCVRLGPDQGRGLFSEVVISHVQAAWNNDKVSAFDETATNGTPASRATAATATGPMIKDWAGATTP